MAGNLHQRKRSRRIYLGNLARGFFLILIIIMILNLIIPDRDYSEGENRSLAKRPAFSPEALADGDFFSDVDTWYSDQFVLRDSWMNLRFTAQKLQGKKETDGVYIGKDGYLMGRPEEADADRNRRTIEAVNAFAVSHKNMHMTAVVVPAAACIMTDKLPDDAPVYDQIGAIRNFTDQLDDTISVPDVISALQDKSSDQLYYKTDHHWTTYGAYTAYVAAANDIGADASERYMDYTVSDSFQGTMASRTGCRSSKDTIDVCEPIETDLQYVVTYPQTGEKSASIFKRESLNQKDQYEVFFGGNYPTVEIQTTVNNGKSLLIFKDSFANSFVQFLLPFYERITMVDPRYYYDNIDTLMSSEKVTDVLFLYSGDTLLDDQNLADTLEAAKEPSGSAGGNRK
ncbi:MAG: DHHW family protein [Eubacteriales bacterium]|jgi:hypothetical protein